MVSLTGYPMCCGASIIQNFSGDTDQSRNNLIELVAKFDIDSGTSSNRMLSVILNDTQCTSQPKTLQTLADLGFVFVARQNNGLHDSWINLFVRTKMRQDAATKYKAPPFKFPGISVEGWSVASHDLMFPFKKKLRNESGVPDPFAPKVHGQVDYTYVLDKPEDAPEMATIASSVLAAIASSVLAKPKTRTKKAA